MKIYIRLSVPIPYATNPARSLQIQQAIVARIELLLSELGEIRDLHKTVDRDINQIMDSIISEIFNSQSMESWNEDYLGNLVKIDARLVDPTKKQYEHLPHIHGGVMLEGICKLLPYNSVMEDAVTSVKFLFSPMSVLYSKIRPKLRKAALVNFQGLCSADVYPLEIQNSQVLIPDFLQWILVSHQFTSYAINLSEPARIPKINQNQLFSYRCRYPNIYQQQKIVNYMFSIQHELDEVKNIHIANKKILDQVEQSILEQAFRGEL